MDNESLPRPFLIEFNGQFVVNPPTNLGPGAEDKVEASVGDRKDAAVFQLKDGYLSKVDGNEEIYFGRFTVELIILMPMPVFWIRVRSMVRQWQYVGNPEAPHMIRSMGLTMGVEPDENQLRAIPMERIPEPMMKLHWQ